MQCNTLVQNTYQCMGDLEVEVLRPQSLKLVRGLVRQAADYLKCYTGGRSKIERIMANGLTKMLESEAFEAIKEAYKEANFGLAPYVRIDLMADFDAENEEIKDVWSNVTAKVTGIFDVGNIHR